MFASLTLVTPTEVIENPFEVQLTPEEAGEAVEDYAVDNKLWGVLTAYANDINGDRYTYSFANHGWLRIELDTSYF